MKFIVDELPKKPSYCPFSHPVSRHTKDCGCVMDYSVCVDTTQCNHLMVLDDYLNKKKKIK